MSVPLDRIENSEAIVSVFGYWPSFHDAEVLGLSMSRDGSGLGRASLEARVHVFEMTNEVGPTGHYRFHKHLIATLRFEDSEELVAEGFNHQNALSGLHIDSDPCGRLTVTFEGAYGVEASLTCSAVKVVSVALGVPAGSVYSAEKA